MFRFSRLRSAKAISALAAFVMLASVLGVLVLTQQTSNAESATQCRLQGIVNVPKGAANVGPGGGNSYPMAMCNIVQPVGGTGSEVKMDNILLVSYDKRSLVGRINSPTGNFFACSDGAWVLTQADTPVAWGWIQARFLDGNVSPCSKPVGGADAKTGVPTAGATGSGPLDRIAKSSGGDQTPPNTVTACGYAGRKVAVPQIVSVAGSHTYNVINCNNADHSEFFQINKPDNTPRTDGGIKGSGNGAASIPRGFLCGHVFGGTTYVLTQGDNTTYNHGNFGWIRALDIWQSYNNGVTPGVYDCADSRGMAANASYSAPDPAKVKKPGDPQYQYNSGVTGTVADNGVCTQTTKYTVPNLKYLGAVAGKNYQLAVCTNDSGVGGEDGINVLAGPSEDSDPVDVLRSTQSFFACGIEGKAENDNENWLLTQGDDNHHWGWIQAKYVHQTVGSGADKGKAGKGGTPGVTPC